MNQRNAIMGLAVLGMFGCNEYTIIPDPEAFTIDMACPLTVPSPYLPEAVDDCVQEPEIGAFDPVIEWQWAENPAVPNSFRVEMAPIVANLTDDNGDGSIDPLDTPDVLITTMPDTYYYKPGSVVVLSGDTGEVVWTKDDFEGHFPLALSGPAIADVDADGLPDLFFPALVGLMRLTHEGEFVWLCDVPTVAGGRVWSLWQTWTATVLGRPSSTAPCAITTDPCAGRRRTTTHTGISAPSQWIWTSTASRRSSRGERRSVTMGR